MNYSIIQHANTHPNAYPHHIFFSYKHAPHTPKAMLSPHFMLLKNNNMHPAYSFNQKEVGGPLVALTNERDRSFKNLGKRTVLVHMNDPSAGSPTDQ